MNVHYDSQSVIYLTKYKNTFHRRIKHIDIYYHFIRDEIEMMQLSLVEITKDNPTYDEKNFSHLKVATVCGFGCFFMFMW